MNCYISYGAVVMPSDIQNRDVWVNQCLSTQTIPLYDLASGQILHNCYVSQEVISNISFPLKPTQMGTRVVYITRNIASKPIVVGTITNDDSFVYGEEFEHKIYKADNEGNYYSLVQSIKSGITSLINYAKGISKIIIRANSASKDATVSIESNGVVDIKAPTINLDSTQSIKLSYKNINSGEVTQIMLSDGNVNVGISNGCNISMDANQVNINNGNLIIKK